MDAVDTKRSTLTVIRGYGWRWVATLKKNRVVNGTAHLEDLRIPAEGRVVHLRGYGPIKVFRSARTSTSAGYLGTDDLALSADAAESLFGARWDIEEFHRGLKQTTGVAECSARRPAAQRAHSGAAVLAFLILERSRLRTGIVWTEVKIRLTRSAIADLLAADDVPLLALVPCSHADDAEQPPHLWRSSPVAGQQSHCESPARKKRSCLPRLATQEARTERDL